MEAWLARVRPVDAAEDEQVGAGGDDRTAVVAAGLFELRDVQPPPGGDVKYDAPVTGVHRGLRSHSPGGEVLGA